MPNKYQSILDTLGFQRPRADQSFLSLTENHLQQIEAKLGHLLPEDYREFLRDYPSIWLNNVDFPINFDGEVQYVGRIGFDGSSQQHDLADTYFLIKRNLEGDDENCSLEWYPGLTLLRDVIKYPEAIGWPDELLPIGFDQAINLICIALYGLRPGAIFFWKQLPSEGEQNLYLVADSFDQFMHMLQRFE